MPITTNGIRKENDKFTYPFRIMLSGSSGAGKTYFAEKLLRNNCFEKEIEYIYYFHPCYLEESPVNWHETMNIPVSYQTGLPSVELLTSMPANSAIILDDLFDKACMSETIDHLFRVISGKRKLSVMIMTQNYFAPGKFGRNIRNSCNYTVLLRNYCDATINRRAVRAMGITKAFDVAQQYCKDDEYPYIFIDQSQKGQVSGFQLYTDIFGRFKKCYSNEGMPSYIIPEKDFLNSFKIIQENNRICLAQLKDENSVQKNTFTTPVEQDEQGNSNRSSETLSKPYSRRRRIRSKRYADNLQ